jgi:Zn-dependent peptidase ImmA (M78 family)/transcriptional regulator with XRE-family HTH domain
MNTTVNTQMIILAREARGMTQVELAQKIGMSPTNLSKIERNEIGVGEESILQISMATFFPINFFLQRGRILPDHLGYRRKQNVPQRFITPINSRINIIKNHVQFLTRGLAMEMPKLPRMEVTSTIDAAKIALKVRQLWNIETPVIDNLVKLFEKKNLIVSSFDFGTERVDSRSILTEEHFPLICFNSALSGDRQRFTLAYELGGLIMHTYHKVPVSRDLNHEANVFAASFLMPEKEIITDFKNGVTIPLLAELKKKWKVSMISLLYRADDLGLLTANQKRYLLQQFNTLQIRRREPPELDIKKEEPQLLRQLIAKYRTKTKLSTSEMAAVFALNTDEYIQLYG